VRARPGRIALALALTALAVLPPLGAGLLALAARSPDLPHLFGPIVAAAVASLPVALVVVGLAAVLARLGSKPLAWVAVACLSVPPPLLGSAALAFVTAAAPDLRRSTAPFVAVCALRLTPLAALLLAAAAERRPLSWFESARLAGLPRRRVLLGISLPSLRGPALAAAALAFLFSFPDVVLAVMLDPPGFDRLGPVVFSRLGTGSAASTALLALTPAGAVAVGRTSSASGM